ncbi:hypothetical protein JQS43_19060 [Natronosporangium hydrolyticum]|uniref:Peptidoglycan-binding protein n=1 Tax=Natronosporangium hydrolyticum TaxID=2811111 RepID=A0A895YIR6_9ACTN|nr:hypothetical protein [Natronosporangium hydrolyticum]QSB13658.1 hypothetical protein JQS43_19060 [Natronosporangium hydrolyticum]
MSLVIENSAPFPVIAGGSGVVTAVHLAPGEEITAGDPVVSVDDRDWLAFTAEAPPWRDITAGMAGDDVARVQEFLDALGFPAGADAGRATDATAEGFRQLNQSLGRGSEDRVFHRDTVLWIGPEPLAVSEVSVQVGEAVSDGVTVLLGPDRPGTVLVEEPESAMDSGSEYVLAVGDVAVPYTVESGLIDDPEAAATIADALPGGEGGGIVRLAEPVEVATMPVSAIVTDPDGRTCVFEDVTGDPTPVETIGGSLSTAQVSEEWIGRLVLVNPHEVREDVSCD